VSIFLLKKILYGPQNKFWDERIPIEFSFEEWVDSFCVRECWGLEKDSKRT
jgi:hypothetical protein